MSLISSESSLLISDVQSIREKLAQIPSKYPLTPNVREDNDEMNDEILSTIKKQNSNMSCSMLREESLRESIQKYDEELAKSRERNRNDSSLSAGIDEHYSVKDEDFEEYHEEPSENIAYRESINIKVSQNHRSLEKSDSNISFATSKHSKKLVSSNISEIEHSKQKSDKEIDEFVDKIDKPPSHEASIHSSKSKITQPKTIDNILKTKENEKNLSNIKKVRPQTAIEKKIEITEKNDPSKKNIIKPVRPVSNHKKIVNEILDNYKEQQKKIREKDDKIYVKETVEKIKPKPHLPPQKQEGNKWNYDTNLKAEKEALDRKKNEVKAQREKTKNKAEEFLKTLEKKMKKETRVKTSENKNPNNNKNDENDIFEEENVEKADEALPDLPNNKSENEFLKIEDEGRNKNEEPYDDNALQQIVNNNKNQEDNEKKESYQNEKNKKKTKDPKLIPEKNIKPKEKQKEEEPAKEKEKSWTYSIGEGVPTEKNRTKKEDSKAQSKRSSSKILELKKKENEKNSKQKEDLINIEKEIQKKQRAYLEQQAAEQRQKKVEAPKEKEPKPLNLQYLAEKVERTEKEDQELKKLTKELKSMTTENKELKTTLKTTITRRQELETQIVQKGKHPNIIVLPNGKITSFGLIPSVLNQKSVKQGEDSLSNVTHLSNNEGLNDASSLEKLVSKINSSGLTLQQLFQLIDFNGDQTITLSELETRLPEIDLKLTNEEKKELIAAVDKNNDGLINEQEFVFSLENPLKFEKEYWKIMGDIKIDHPQILEERILDLKFRKPQTLKESAAFEEKNNKNTQEISRLANKLKELEQTFSKRKKKDSNTESNLIRKRDQLILEVQNLEEELEKDKRNCEERQKEANRLIENLKEELITIAEKVLKKKQSLSQNILDYQKLQIKEMAYSKMETKIMSLKEEREKMENEKLAKIETIKARVRAKNIDKMSIFIQAQLQTSCATKIQKLIRGKLDRLRTMRIKEEKSKSKDLIVKNFRNLKFKQNAKKNRNFCIFLKFLINSQQKFGFQQLRKNYEGFKKKGNVLFEEEEIKKADQSLPTTFFNERNGDLELFEDQFIEEGDQLLPSANRKSIKQGNESPEKSEILSNSNSFGAASIIQNNFRHKWGRVRKNVGFSLHHLPESEYCLQCKGKYGENKLIEIICLKCRDSFFCSSCFELTHHNGLMNNHKFINIEEEKQLMNEAEKICGKIAANLHIKKLEANLNSEDKAKNGLTTYAKVSDILRKMLKVEHHDLLKNFDLILNKCSLNQDMTYLRFKGKNEYFYDKREKYIDIGVLLSFLTIQTNE